MPRLQLHQGNRPTRDYFYSQNSDSVIEKTKAKLERTPCSNTDRPIGYNVPSSLKSSIMKGEKLYETTDCTHCFDDLILKP